MGKGGITMGTRIDHAALFAILSSLADNKQAIGRRYAYWCNGAPALEAAVAAAAMARDGCAAWPGQAAQYALPSPPPCIASGMKRSAGLAPTTTPSCSSSTARTL